MLSDGLSLATSRLFLTSSELEEHDERIVKSSCEAVCPVSRQCVRILVDGGLTRVLPMRARFAVSQRFLFVNRYYKLQRVKCSNSINLPLWNEPPMFRGIGHGQL